MLQETFDKTFSVTFGVDVTLWCHGSIVLYCTFWVQRITMLICAAAVIYSSPFIL